MIDVAYIRQPVVGEDCFGNGKDYFLGHFFWRKDPLEKAPGRRPRGPSGLTLFLYLVNPNTGGLTGLLVPPAWPAHGSANIRETQHERSHHTASYAHGPSSPDSGIHDHAEQSWLEMGRVDHSRDYHLDKMPEYERSSSDDLNSDSETLPQSSWELPRCWNRRGPISRARSQKKVAWEEEWRGKNTTSRYFFRYGSLERRTVDPRVNESERVVRE